MNKPQIVRHGEVILKPSKLPTGAVLKAENKKYIVAHSETGHHHTLESTKDFKVYSWNGETYIELPEMGNLLHEKTGKDVHTPHKIAPSVYKVVIKKHYDYFAKKMSQVRD